MAIDEFNSMFYGEVPDGDEPIEETLRLLVGVVRDYGDVVNVSVFADTLIDAANEITRLRTICEERKAEIQYLQSVVVTLQ